MDYEARIKTRLFDSSKWPKYSKPDVMASLDEMADDALTVGKIDERSCIASILIIQQLTEELLKILLESCYFLVQVRLLPFEMMLEVKKKKMFGGIVEDLRATIQFENKEEIIVLANKINSERIDIAHRLIEKGDFSNLPKRAMQVRKDFEEFYELYDYGYDWIRICLKDLKKDLVDDDEFV